MRVRISGGRYRGRQIHSRRCGDLRPTAERVRSAVFSIIGLEALNGARVLDLYAGTGVMSVEAISRGARHADLVEVDSRRADEIRENLRGIEVEGRTKVYTGRVVKVVDSLPGGYDLVFADPPYELQEWDILMNTLNRPGVVNSGGLVIAEHRRGTELAERYDTLERVDDRDTVIP